MGFPAPPRPNLSYDYPDLVQKLALMLFEGQQAKRRQDLAQQELDQRKAQIQAEAADRMQRRQAADLQQQVAVAGLKQSAAAQTPITEAPTTPLGTEPLPGLTEEHGAVSPEEAAYMGGGTTQAPQVPKRQVSITLPSGETVPLAPLQYKEEAQAEARKQQSQALADALTKLGLSTELTESIKAKYKPDAEDKAQPTREINGRVMMWEKKTRGYTKDIGSAADPAAVARKLAEEKKKETDADAEDKAVANEWQAGRTFPQTQKATSSALAYMEAHPIEFPPDLRPRKLTPPQQADVLGATYTLDRIGEIRKAYAKVKKQVGPVTYTFNEITRKIPGTASDPNFTTFNTLLRGMDNLEIKFITGAQMSAQEATRLLKGMATGNQKPADFEAALNVMESNAKTKKDIWLFGKTLGDEGVGAGEPAPGATTTPATSVGKYKILSVEQ